jgi:hypothetical protein
MAKEISTQITINTSPEKIWSLLSYTESYPNWNPFIKSIKGTLAVGNKIEVKIQAPQSKAMNFSPTILAFEKNKEFRWLGHLLFRGLFDGEHKFEIIDHANGTCTFIQSEKFKGILVPLFAKMLDNNTKLGFQQMNEKLKQLAEQK